MPGNRKSPDQSLKPKKKKKQKKSLHEDIAIAHRTTSTDSLSPDSYLPPVMYGNNQPQVVSPSQQPYNNYQFPQQFQSPQYVPQFHQMSPSMSQPIQNIHTSNNSELPTWLSSLTNDIKEIKQNLSKLDTIEKTVIGIDSKVVKLDQEVKNLNDRVAAVELSQSFVSDKFDTQKTSIDNTNTEVTQMKAKIKELTKTNEDLKKESDSMKKTMIDTQARSMRENLIFYGIPEVPKDETEDCQNSVKTLLSDKLGITITENNMEMDRAHRIGIRKEGINQKPRPIVVKFHKYTEKEKIRKSSYMLKGTDYSIGEQFPKEIVDKRKLLVPVMKEAKKKGKTARLSYDKLYIDNKLYSGNTVPMETSNE